MEDKEFHKQFCEEMSKVCLMIAETAKLKKQKKEFENKAEIFKNLSKIYSNN